jgi:PleD family two-component response regulator
MLASKRKSIMKILIADQEDQSRLAVQAFLVQQGHEVVVTSNAADTWKALQVDAPPAMVVLNWNLRGADVPEMCKKIRATTKLKSLFVILLVPQENYKSLLEGLAAGANDYVRMPFDIEELGARIFVGAQMLQLQSELAQRVVELEEALANVKQLQGLLPICSYCKSIRDDQDYWHRVEHYIGDHSDARFSHGICPDCWKKIVEPELRKMGQQPPA